MSGPGLISTYITIDMSDQSEASIQVTWSVLTNQRSEMTGWKWMFSLWLRLCWCHLVWVANCPLASAAWQRIKLDKSREERRYRTEREGHFIHLSSVAASRIFSKCIRTALSHITSELKNRNLLFISFLITSSCSFVPDILYLILSFIIVANLTFVCKKKLLQYHQTRLCSNAKSKF